MATTFWTSDPHFGHRNIGALCGRPWDSVEAMDQGLADRWNQVVNPADTVWVLGDFSLSLTALKWVSVLNGTKFLVAGNHDHCWDHHRKSQSGSKVARYVDAGFAKVFSSGVVHGHTIGGREVVLSHLPYYGDSQHDERYTDQRPADEGLPLICGHVHNTWAQRYGSLGRVHRNQINVGVDVWNWSPVPEDLLTTYLAGIP